jgi:hypothetical protein
MGDGAGEITQAAIRKGLLKSSGKARETAMGGALHRELKDTRSIFFRPRTGLYGLREWETKGIAYKVCLLTLDVVRSWRALRNALRRLLQGRQIVT